MYDIVNIVAKKKKIAFGIVVEEGERVKAVLTGNGYAKLVRNQNIMFKPNEFELYISDKEFEKLLDTTAQ